MKYRKIRLPFRLKEAVLALGGDVKNAICFARDREAFVSDIIGDLKDVSCYFKFQNAIRSAPVYLRARPKIIACDLHPEYLSVKYAASLPNIYKAVYVQHHHAHIASCMAESMLTNSKVIGVAFDGTGLGDDNTLWGAEFLICDYSGFKRAAHLKNMPLIGGEKAILEPWRLLCAWLYSIYGDDFLELKVNIVKSLNRKKWMVLKKMLLSDLNSPLSSSMGRLFDAVGALVLGKSKVRFEAQAAIALERKVTSLNLHARRAYRFNIKKENSVYIIDPALMFKEIVADLMRKEDKGVIAARFHFTIAHMVEKMCLRLRRETGINKVVLSGGVFQNNILKGLATDLLSQKNFAVYGHKMLSCSDAGISLGQAAVAAHLS